MSGVLGKKFGRKYSRSGPQASSSTYSVSSWREFFQVKYVYPCVKPILASWRIIARRVNASDRKITSRSSSWTSAISHCQNGTGLVCGLSTRKTLTPHWTQNTKIRRHSSHRPRQSSHSQLTL